ncbi:sensor histidine kinase [Rickettsiella massiliensis]|uniref:sensor histidine kinase n=1 Tax=Rickettsiella massiliensis TaxID=676517 RepID=UPI000299F347|nr:HAMP domain-containing sensor histidine kinase [Rickettsiella massiliensis]
MLNAPSTKLIDLVNSTIVSSALDAFGVNYSAFDINGNAIVQNKSMESTISKGEVIAEKIDQSAWEDCEKIMKSLKGEITEEEFKGKYYLSMKQPIMENNQCVGIVIISFDISEKKQAELAKSAFVMNMAHDLRTPFSAIVGLAQCQAVYGSKTPQEVKDNGTMIYQSGNQLLEILDSVVVALGKNNIDDIKKDKIDLYKFAQEMQELIKPNIVLSNLEFELKVGKDIGEIVTDKIRLKQILANLLSNAVNFTPEGKITLSFELIKQDKLKITVSDTGIGICEDDHERVFEKYEKIKPSYKSSTFTGVGMGLYLVKQLIEQLNGKISLTSSLGNGSIFQVEIPFTA